MTRTDYPTAPDERSTLLVMLDFVRDTAVFKVNGMNEDNFHRAPIGTSPLTNPASLLNHLRWVEAYWFEEVMAGTDIDAPWTAEDPDGEMTIAQRMSLHEVLAGYAAQRELSNAVIAARDLDDLAVRNKGKDPHNLRWIILHLIEETARHNGHLDLLREMADGTVGD